MPPTPPPCLEGSPSPLGASFDPRDQSWNFALASRNASGVTLLLYTPGELVTPMLAIPLDPIRNRTGSHWHCRIAAKDMQGAAYYAYRVAGPRADAEHSFHAFDEAKILHDPATRSLFFPPGFDRALACKPGANAGKAPLSVLPRPAHAFDWGDDRPVRHGHDLVIYELHVRGFTRHPSSGVPLARRGSFAGIIDKIPYLQDLGVTAVELMPVFQFDPQEGNYWGYMPLSFFSVHHAYASDDALAKDPAWGARDEFRTMVKALHKAGIEVIIDVVHNHTGEGDEDDPTYSLKGIDNSLYYAASGDARKPYADFSGTGNALNGNTPEARQLVIDSLRSWIDEMHVDGFRHDLASVVMRGPDGHIERQPAAAVASMAVRELHGVRHIAEPWDPAGAYLVGKAFPLHAAWQWNGKFRDVMRRFARGDAGMVGEVVQRLYGSDDLFPDAGPIAFHPRQSVNYITSHDGFTLHDLVSYTKRRNEANGHNNTDGPQEEYASNNGFEGDSPETPADVRLKRVRHAKNLLTLLFISAGTPMLRMGDEFLQTQRGNNNPYNQDSETTWLDWSRVESNRGFFRFVKGLIAFRKAHPSLGRSRFWREDVRWFGASAPNGSTAVPVDFSRESRALAFILDGSRENDADIAACINMHDEPKRFTLPLDGRWTRAIDTARSSPDDAFDPSTPGTPASREVHVEARSIVILTRTRA